MGNHTEGQSIGTSRFKRINPLLQFKDLFSPVPYHEWKSQELDTELKVAV